MKRLTQEQLADMSMVVNKTTREMVKKVLVETGMNSESDERICAIASMCAAQAASLTMAYLYEVEDSGAPNLGFSGESVKQ